MTARFIPYGELDDGSFGFPLDASNNPTAAAVEIQATLPSTGDAGNFEGRTVFSIANANVYIFHNSAWLPLIRGAVTIGSAAPTNDNTVPDGTLYYATSNGILYLCISGNWIGIAGRLGAGVIWKYYTGDGVTSQFDTGTGQMPPVDYVQVFANGIELYPGADGLRDYYMVGNLVQLNATPSTNTHIAIRTLLFINPTANSSFFARRYVADGTSNSFDTGSQLIKPGQVLVTIDGVVQVVDTSAGAGTYDYKIATQNNTIATLTASGSTVTATTAAAHGYVVNDSVTVVGSTQTQYNGTFAVTSVPTTTSFTYTALSTPSVSPATGTPRYGPLKLNDRIVFYDGTGAAAPLDAGAVVYIQTVANLIPNF